MLEDALKVKDKLIITIGIMALIVFIIGVFLVNNIVAWLIGVAIGAALSIARVLHILSTLDKGMSMQADKAVLYSRAMYTLRYSLTMIIALVAIVLGSNAYGVIGGLILVQPAVYISGCLKNQ